MFAHAEGEEVLRLITADEVEVCDECQTYRTSDGEVVMDVFKCDAQQEYCLNCCGCPDHKGGHWS